MIYFSNTSITLPHMAFIGRWSPFHKGHSAIILKKISEHPQSPILIMIRDTGVELYSTQVRAEYIKTWMIEHHIKGTISIIPNIEGVYWGRDVGYHTERIDIDDSLKKISGSNIRKQIKKQQTDWKASIAIPKTSYLLSPSLASFMTKGLVLWLTGCPSSGKTTIAKTLSAQMHKNFPYIRTQILDGDDMRNSPMAKHVGFSKKDRAEHILRMAYLAKLFADHGIIVICAFVSPDNVVRKQAKATIGAKRFLEIYVRATKKSRIKRDTKGLYKKATQGSITNLTGYNAPYEIPKYPDIICDTDTQTLLENVEKILARISKLNTTNIV